MYKRQDGGDEVIGMICIKDPEAESIMVVSEQGYGKRSDIEDYRKTNRGGKGVKTLNITDKTGKLVAIKSVTDENDLMIINKSGITIRLNKCLNFDGGYRYIDMGDIEQANVNAHEWYFGLRYTF